MTAFGDKCHFRMWGRILNRPLSTQMVGMGFVDAAQKEGLMSLWLLHLNRGHS